MEVRPIAVNPGGVVDLRDIVGRDDERDRLLTLLQTQSVILTGERRMGKTSLARLISAAAADDGWSVVRQSAEGLRSLEELADELVSRFETMDGPLRRVGRTLRDSVTFQAGPVNVDFRRGASALEQVVSSAVTAADGRLLLVLDELPLFARLLNVREDGTGADALHLLRRLREQHAGLRMLCLGSVGFHHVVRQSASGVLNDTQRTRLLPLEADMAVYLANCLLLGSGLAVDDPDVVAPEIAAGAERVPYYIHRIVEAAERRPARRIAPGDATRLLRAALTTPDDPWDLRHYRDRIPAYFGEHAALASAVLDVFAAADAPLTLETVVDRLNVDDRWAPVDPQGVRDLIERLEDDHYLLREGATRRFAFELVRAAWVELRR